MANSSGFVLLNKAAGETSFKALFPIKRLFKTRRVGHAGTLDLRASGLIIAAVGRATRLLPYVEAADKVYTFKLHLGYETETLEWDSDVTKQDVPKQITAADLEKVLSRFTGEILQEPPAYCAVKIQGVRVSDLANRGREVSLPARPIRIDSLKIIGESEPIVGMTGQSFASFDMECRCSKGTYIRALCRDLGHSLGTFGVASSICRTAIGNISVQEASFSENLTENSLLQVNQVLPYPTICLDAASIAILRNGHRIQCEAVANDLKSQTINDKTDFFNTESAKIKNSTSENFVFAADCLGKVQALCVLNSKFVIPKIFIGSDDA